MKDSNRFTSTVAGASIFIAGFGLISKGIGFLREILFASLFGLSTSFDIYLIGAIIPLTINTIIICLGQNYLIPAYNRFKENDELSSENFIRKNFFLFIGGGILLAGILYLFSDLIITSYLQNYDNNLKATTLNVFTLFLLTIPLTSAISVITAYQQSNFEFRSPAVSQLICNIVILLAVYFLTDLNIYAIPIGYILGSVIQLIVLIIKSKNLFSNFAGLLISSEVYKTSIPFSLIVIILIESIGQLYLISDRYFFNSVIRGGISALNYAMTVFMLPLSILSIALSTAIFPKLSQLFSRNLNSELEKTFYDGMVITALIFTPIMFLFMFYGDTVLQVIFERGKFSEIDTLITNDVLFYYSISIVFYASYGILNKIFYTSGLINQLLYITIAGIVIKILLNFLLVGQMGQNGLALSTSLSFIFFFALSFILIFKKLSFRNKSTFFVELFLHLINCLVSVFIVKIIASFFPGNTLFSYLEIILFLLINTLNLFLLKSSSFLILIKPLKRIEIFR